MPVDFSEAHGQARSALFDFGDRRFLFAPVAFEFNGGSKAAVRVLLKKYGVVNTVADVLTDLSRRVDPTASSASP